LAWEKQVRQTIAVTGYTLLKPLLRPERLLLRYKMKNTSAKTNGVNGDDFKCG